MFFEVVNLETNEIYDNEKLMGFLKEKDDKFNGKIQDVFVTKSGSLGILTEDFSFILLSKFAEIGVTPQDYDNYDNNAYKEYKLMSEKLDEKDKRILELEKHIENLESYAKDLKVDDDKNL